MPDQITLDQRGANPAPLDALNKGAGQAIEMRQIKYPNHRAEQDHQAVKPIIRLMFGFKVFDSAGRTWRGSARMPVLKKGERVASGGEKRSTAGPLYSWQATALRG